ncbi:MAG: hypothetical protein AAFN93_00255 [Bacteroidota bacterium]
MQRKKNIRLIGILMTLLIILVVLSFVDQKKDQLDISRDSFSLANTNEINRVEFSSASGKNRLDFQRNDWTINQKYKADLQRITVLFSVLKQVKVRKKVAKLEQPLIDSLFQNQGVKVSFYSGEVLEKEFLAVGYRENNLTYFNNGDETYIVQIPGYNVYIADIFGLDENGWRDPLVVNMDWINLSSVEMVYPERLEDSFKVDFVNRNFIIDGIDQPDSTRVGNFLDDVSTLYVNDYLFAEELSQYDSLLSEKQATVLVTDVGKNSYSIEFFQGIDRKEILVRIDSSEYGLVDYNKARKILRPKSFFRPERGGQ